MLTPLVHFYIALKLEYNILLCFGHLRNDKHKDSNIVQNILISLFTLRQIYMIYFLTKQVQ